MVFGFHHCSSTSCQLPNSVGWKRDDYVGWFCSHSTWAPCNHWVDHEVFHSQLWGHCAKAWPKLGHRTIGQWHQTLPTNLQQNAWKRISVALKCWHHFKRAGKRMLLKLSELKSCCKEAWVRFPSQYCERLLNHTERYFKVFLLYFTSYWIRARTWLFIQSFCILA